MNNLIYYKNLIFNKSLFLLFYLRDQILLDKIKIHDLSLIIIYIL